MGKAYDRAVLADSPLFYFRLDEGADATALDLSGNGRVATYQASPTKGVLLGIGSEKAVRLNGTSQYITIPDEAAFDFVGTVACSFEAWLRPTVTSNFSNVWSHEDSARLAGYHVLIHNSQGVRFTRNAGQDAIGPVPTTGLLYHVIGTYDGTNIRLYLNGALAATSPTDVSAMVAVASTLAIGRDSSDPDSFMQMDVARVSAYSTALTPAQVAEHYRTGLIPDGYDYGNPRPRPRAELRMWDKKFNILHFFKGASGTLTQSAQAGTLVLIGTTTKNTSRALPATLFLVGATTKFIARRFPATLQFIGSTLKQVGRTVRSALRARGPFANLATDTSFENGVSQWLADWATKAATTAQAFHGAQSAELTAINTNSFTFEQSLGGQNVVVQPGTNYIASFYVRPNTTVRNAVADIAWFNAAGNSIGNSAGTSGPETSGAWVRFDSGGSHPAPADAVTARGRITIGNPVGGEIHYVDAYQFEVGNTATAYDPNEAVLAKRPGKLLSATLPLIGNIVSRAITRPLTATLPFVGVVAKQTSRALSATLALVGAIPKKTARLLSGTLSLVGASTMRTVKALVATLPLVGTVAKFTSHVLPATSSFVGTVFKQTQHAFAATLAFVASMTPSHIVLLALAATLAFAGSLPKRTGKALNATVSFAGLITNRTNKALLATLSFAGAVTRQIGRALAATLPWAGTTFKSIARTMTATLSFVGAVNTLKAFGRLLQATLTFVGSQTKFIGKPQPATLPLVGTTTKQVSRALAATLVLLGSVFRQTRRGLAATLSFVGTMTTLKAFTALLVATLSFVGSQTKQIGRPLPATLPLVGAATKLTRRTVAATSSFVVTVAKQTNRFVVATLSFIGATTTLKAFGRLLQATVSFVGSQSKAIGKPQAATLPLVGTTTKLASRALTATLALSGITFKSGRRALAATLSFVGGATMLKAFTALLVATLSFVGSQTKRTGHNMTATLSSAGSIARAVSRTLQATLSFSGSTFKRTSRAIAATLSFIGATAASHQFFRTLVATLLFVGNASRQTGKAANATLSFVGTITQRAVGKAFAATVALTGSAFRFIKQTRGSTLVFAGSAFKRFLKPPFTATLSFVGAESHFRIVLTFVKNLAATLALGGVIQRRTGHGLVSTLALSGQTARGHMMQMLLTASLSLVGFWQRLIRIARLPIGKTSYQTYFHATTSVSSVLLGATAYQRKAA